LPDHVGKHGGRYEKQPRRFVLAVAAKRGGFIVIFVRGVGVVAASAQPIRIKLLEMLAPSPLTADRPSLSGKP